MMQKILIVDDDRLLREGLATRLRTHGFGTVFAADGATAVLVARRETPDLILLDIGLPAGDGFVVMSRLHQLMSVSSIPIIVISARPADTNRDKALEAGARSFLQKPLDNEQLLAAIHEALGLPPVASSQEHPRIFRLSPTPDN
jgi:DNA-binding response OmpR family regulator